MKKKLIAVFLVLSAVFLLAATNSFDNITVTTTSRQAGITRFLTNGINGVTIGIWSNGQFGVGQAINPGAGILVDMHQFQDGQTKIRLFNTNTGTSVSSVMQIKADAADGIVIGVVGQNFAGSTPGSTAEIYSELDIENFMFLTQRAGTPFFFRTSTGEKFRISDAAGVLVTNTSFKATQNATIVSNLTIGAFAGSTFTINGTTVTGPNTLLFNGSLYSTNGGTAVNTNSMPTTIAFLSQANAITQIPLVGRGFGGQTADLLSLQSSVGGILFSVSSAGTIDTITGNANASLSSSGLSLVNNGGTANVVNNTATANSTLNIGGGTGAGSQVTISASGVTMANFTTNTITLSQPTFINSGQRVKRVQTGTNYTLSATDYYVAVKGTTATAVTNFLPAAGGNIGAGTSYIIKDAQRSAGTTNIVIDPAGADTIDNAATLTFTVDGDAQLLIFDGVSNWETGNL